jgi:conserved oligomeric Golgi complex subunit 5
VYTQAYQRCADAVAAPSPVIQIGSDLVSPETVLVFRALSTFESLYLARSSTRLNEAVAQATRTPTAPGLESGVNIGRVVINELDSAKFDPLLVKSISKGAVASLDGLIGRAETLV